MYYILTVLCVLGISIGQILFKTAAVGFNNSGTWFNFNALIILFFALFLYAVTTVGWVIILRHLPLIKAYPFMALAFIIVPMLSFFFLGEEAGFTYWLGTLLITIGIIVTFI